MNYYDIQGWFDAELVYDKAYEAFKNDDDVIFVEVGSWKGKSTVYMAQLIKGYISPPVSEGMRAQKCDIKFYAVDHFKGSDEDAHRREIADLAKLGKTLFDVFYGNLVQAGVAHLVFPIQTDSISATRCFQPHSISFCYLDGAHDFQSVTNDLSAWYMLMKHGGILAGHDWYWGEVNQAVTQFARAYNLKVEVLGKSWFIKI